MAFSRWLVPTTFTLLLSACGAPAPSDSQKSWGSGGLSGESGGSGGGASGGATGIGVSTGGAAASTGGASSGGSPATGGGSSADACLDVDCGNGSCQSSNGEASCSCDLGWTGADCKSAVVSGCADAPCAHGSCADESSGAYSCACDSGWTGPNCDQNIDDCAVHPCENGSCIDGVDSFSCSCSAGWTGTTCSDNIDDCSPNPCTHGSCNDDVNAYSCSCDAGWTGSTCAEQVSGCSDSPCSHGSCTDTGPGTYTCACSTGYSGTNCDSCANNYVLENGSCIHTKQVSCRDVAPSNATSNIQNVTITYTTGSGWSTPAACSYTCKAGWTGANCNTSIDDCVSNSCQNGSSCVDGHQSYTCSCLAGYAGTYCQTNVDDCGADPCDHGTCVDGVNTFSCSCDTGYAGGTCSSCATDYISEAGACIHQKQASCIDVAPTNATSIPANVTIYYSSSTGWSTPDDCEYQCNSGYTGQDCSTVDTTDAGLIDGFASCDDFIEIAEGRHGQWYDYAGSGVGGYDADRSDPGWGVGCGAWMVGGLSSWTNLYAGMGFGLNADGPTYDASGYEAVQVTYSSDQPVTFYAKWDNTGAAGTRSSVALPATSGLNTVTVPLANFSGIKTSTLTEFQFEPSDISLGFGVAVYEIRFTGGSSSPCSNGETRCTDSGGLEVCSAGAWTSSSCSTGQICSANHCVDEDATPVEIHGHLSVSGTQLVDENGQAVQLKGVSTHWLNFADSDNYETNLSALVWMRDNWNLSVIRAAMGTEQDGGYLSSSTAKNAMLADIDAIVSNAVSAGVYVIIDWHSHYAHNQTASAQQFFSDMVGLYGHLPNVLYEIYNEPLDIDWNSVLKPYHTAVSGSIRSAETSKGVASPGVILLGTPNWDQDVDDVIGNQVSGVNLMYTVHFYSCSHKSTERNKAQSALASGVPIFVSEWGATHADGGISVTTVCSSEADTWHDWMNNNDISWAAWKLDDCDYEISTRGYADISCILAKDAPANGGWTDNYLNGHGPYVRSKMQN